MMNDWSLSWVEVAEEKKVRILKSSILLNYLIEYVLPRIAGLLATLVIVLARSSVARAVIAISIESVHI